MKTIPIDDALPLRDALRELLSSSKYWTRQRAQSAGEPYTPSDEERQAEKAIDLFNAFHGDLPSEDPSLYCQYCGAKEKHFCKCGPIAKNH